MTLALIINIVLAAVVLTVIVGMIGWAIRSSVPRDQARLPRAERAPAREPQTATSRRRAYGSLVRNS